MRLTLLDLVGDHVPERSVSDRQPIDPDVVCISHGQRNGSSKESGGASCDPSTASSFLDSISVPPVHVMIAVRNHASGQTSAIVGVSLTKSDRTHRYLRSGSKTGA